MKPIDRRFRFHSTLIAGVAVSVAVTLVAPVVAEASQQGIPISVIALLNAGVLMLGIAYLLWSSAWTEGAGRSALARSDEDRTDAAGRHAAPRFLRTS